MTEHKYITINPVPSVSFAGMLAVLFIYLKLTETIDWSWVWVLCPLWIGPTFLLIFFVIFGLLVLIGLILGSAFAFFTK